MLTGALARQLGGRRFAQGLAALAVLVAPGYLAVDSYLSMNSVEPLLWMGCALVLIRIIRSGNVRLWIWFGVLAGLGLENKLTMLLFGFALIAGLLLTAERRWLANRWFLLGGLAAFLIFLPNLIWMIDHHFPHLELLANIRRNQRNVALTPLQFVGQQILTMQPLAFPIWLCGLWSLLIGRDGRRYRALGWAYLLALGTLLLTDGRFYYLLPAYPMLFAAGAVAIEGWLDRPRWGWVRPAYVALLALTGMLFAPIAMPVLPPATLVRYTEILGVSQPTLEHRQSSALPQLFADRFGWPDMVATVAKVYDALPPAERAKTAIYANDYGEAGAIDFYGPALGLPKAISGHLTYWYWGPREYTGENVIVLGLHGREKLERVLHQRRRGRQRRAPVRNGFAALPGLPLPRPERANASADLAGAEELELSPQVQVVTLLSCWLLGSERHQNFKASTFREKAGCCAVELFRLLGSERDQKLQGLDLSKRRESEIGKMWRGGEAVYATEGVDSRQWRVDSGSEADPVTRADRQVRC